MTLGRTIARLRKGKDMKQSDLAVLMDVHPTYVTRWEKDRVRPRGKTLAKLAEALGVPTSELLAAVEDEAARQNFQHLKDPRLAELLSQVHKLEEKDQEVLKRILETMLTRIELEAVLNRAHAKSA